MYESFEDIISALVSATQAESGAKWDTGDILVEGTKPDALRRFGMTKRQLLTEVGVAVGRGKRTIQKRLKTSLAFPPDARNDAVSWEAHHLCATTDTPLYWLQVAADQQLSVDELEAAIKAAGGEPTKGDPEYLYRAHSMAAVFGDGGIVVLYEVEDAPPGARIVTVTMLEYPADQPEAQDAQTARDIGQRVVTGMLLGNDVLSVKDRLLDELVQLPDAPPPTLDAQEGQMFAGWKFNLNKLARTGS